MPEPEELCDLLAPVPLVHLLSAVESGMPSEVAFGSDKDQLFSKLGAGPKGMRVWIYASMTGSASLADPARRRQRVCFVGDFGGSTPGLSHKSLDEVRPVSAKRSDSPWTLLWLVRNLQPIEPQLYRKFLSAKTGKPLAKEPQGPMLIRPPTEDLYRALVGG